VKQQITFLALIIVMVGNTAPSTAQHGGKGSGSPEPESTPMGIQHISPNAGSKYKEMVCGVVKDVSKDEVVLAKTQMGDDESFRLSKKTKFVLDGKESSLESVHTGDRVWVAFDEDKKTGEMFARKVINGVFVMPSN